MDQFQKNRITHENICEIFAEAGDFNTRQLRCGDYMLWLYAIDGLTSGSDISEYVIWPVMTELSGQSMSKLYEAALLGGVFNSVAKPCADLDQVATFLVNGFCVLFFPEVGAVAFEVKTGEKRGISPPDLENTTKGAKDSFVETVRTNTSLIRRHLRTPNLRIYETMVGRRSLTNVSVIWINGLTNMDYVHRMKTRLNQIDIDGFLAPSAVEEYVTGSRATAFPLLQYTERTDRFCRGLLKGRVGLLVDGIPVGYLAPVDIGYLMNSPEDIGRDYISASWVRVLRYGALFLGLLLPAILVSFSMYHLNWVPQPFADLIIRSRELTPFSTATEVLGLLIAFELLQESGIHLPHSVGQAVSIVGGIVLGTAGVEAGLVSPMALIAVSTAGICGFVLPNRDLAAAIRFWRFALTGAAALGGIWAAALTVGFLIFHLSHLKSLGVPYLKFFESGLLRQRLVFRKYRPKSLKTQDKKNQK